MNQLSLFLVAGPPSRHHWKPDSDASHCEYPLCATSFGLFDRRHHCRRCGDIFCSLHCSNYCRLDSACEFDTQGVLSRVCDNCIQDYRAWSKRRNEERRLIYQCSQKQVSFSSLSEPSTVCSPHLNATQLQKQSSPRKPSPSKQLPGVTTLLPSTESTMEIRRDSVQKNCITLGAGVVKPMIKSIAINNNQKNKKPNDAAFSPIPSVPADWQWSTF